MIEFFYFLFYTLIFTEESFRKVTLEFKNMFQVLLEYMTFQYFKRHYYKIDY